MKKFFAISTIFLGFLPFSVLAITPGTIPGANELGIPEAPVKTSGGLLNILSDVVGWVYTIFFIIAVLFIIFAAFNFLTAQGDLEKIKSARNQIMWAVVAIVVALMAVGANAIIKNFLQGETNPAGNANYEGGWSPDWSQD